MYVQPSVYKDLANEARFLTTCANPSTRAMRRFLERVLDRSLNSDLDFYFLTWTRTQQQEILQKLKDTWAIHMVPGLNVTLHLETDTPGMLRLSAYTPQHNVRTLRVVVSRWKQEFDPVNNRWTLQPRCSDMLVAPSLKDWKSALESFHSVCLLLHRTLVQVNDFLSEKTYVYRGLPCSCVHESALWSVSGQDRRGGSGVLEWATSQEDAEHIKAQMAKEPARFVGITCERYIKVEDLSEEDKQEVGVCVFISNAPTVTPTWEGLEVLRTFGKEQVITEDQLFIGMSYWVSGPRYRIYELCAKHPNTYFSFSPMLGQWFTV